MDYMLTKNELKQAKCAIPGCENCDHDIYLHGRCHPHGGLDVFYDKAIGCLVVQCHRCATLVAQIAVAEGVIQ